MLRPSDLRYDHPEEACALRPAARREDARLLVSRADGSLEDDAIATLPAHVGPGEILVLNETRVQPARIDAVKESGGHAELLVLGRMPCGEGRSGSWLAMVRSSHAPRPGRRLRVAGGCVLEMIRREGDLFVLREAEGDLEDALRLQGRPPLPPYIRRDADADDVVRYQTTFARARADWGTAASSVAAPTAGLHLTPGLLAALEAAGARIVRVALGVGPGTFRPIEAARLADHRMHEEDVELGDEAAEVLTQAARDGRRITAVGTTSLRVVEAAATPGGRIRALSGRTGLFLHPGSRIRIVDRLLTNFHRPESSLLALVAGFAGLWRALDLHRQGVARGYRLFSYGDATLVERAP